MAIRTMRAYAGITVKLTSHGKFQHELTSHGKFQHEHSVLKLNTLKTILLSTLELGLSTRDIFRTASMLPQDTFLFEQNFSFAL